MTDTKVLLTCRLVLTWTDIQMQLSLYSSKSLVASHLTLSRLSKELESYLLATYTLSFKNDTFSSQVCVVCTLGLILAGLWLQHVL